MTLIYDLHFRTGNGLISHYFCSEIYKLIEFLNHPNQRWGEEWHTVVVVQLDTNVRQQITLHGFQGTCNTFTINKQGLGKPLN